MLIAIARIYPIVKRIKNHHGFVEKDNSNIFFG